MFKKRGEIQKYRGFFAQRRELIATSTLIGTIVGAGMLGIPYAVAKAGLLYGLLLIIVMGGVFLFLNLMLGEIVLRTKEQHQLTGYAEKYLGPRGKRLMTLVMFLSLYGALTAYLLGEGFALHAIFKFGSPILYTGLFFFLTLGIVWRGIKSTGKAELYLIFLLLIVVAVIGFVSLNKIESHNLTWANPGSLFLPYGVIMFALLAFPAIPEMQEELGTKKKYFKKSIIIGSIIPVLLYLLFTFIVVGSIGQEKFSLLEPNQRIATIALSIYTYPLLGLFANLLAVLAMFTSFLSLSTALIEMYELDYHLSRLAGFVLTFALPLIIVLTNVTSFIAILGITGGIAGGLEGICLIQMYRGAKKRGNREPEYSLPSQRFLWIVLTLLFALGMIYELGIIFHFI